jgi:hypothetical protein
MNCIFCGEVLQGTAAVAVNSRTKEHIFPKWIRDLTPNDGMSLYETTIGASPTFVRRVPLDGFVSKKVCKKCNNGWMSDLEARVESIARSLIGGRSIWDLSAPELETVGRWTGKTMAVLSFATPQQKHVPLRACRSLHPESSTRPILKVFYADLRSDPEIPGAHLQITYGHETPIIGSDELVGTRIGLCLKNRVFIADFPPMIEGVVYSLEKSVAAQIWPTRSPAGTNKFLSDKPPDIREVMYQLVNSIEVGFDTSALRT